MKLNENEYRKRQVEKIENNQVDYRKLADESSPKYKVMLEENLKYLKEYANQHNLTEEQYKALEEIECINMRNRYLEERTEEAYKSGDIYADRDIKNNNAEIMALNAQYDKREAALGGLAVAAGSYIDSRYNENHKKNTVKR